MEPFGYEKPTNASRTWWKTKIPNVDVVDTPMVVVYHDPCTDETKTQAITSDPAFYSTKVDAARTLHFNLSIIQGEQIRPRNEHRTILGVYAQSRLFRSFMATLRSLSGLPISFEVFQTHRRAIYTNFISEAIRVGDWVLVDYINQTNTIYVTRYYHDKDEFKDAESRNSKRSVSYNPYLRNILQ